MTLTRLVPRAVNKIWGPPRPSRAVRSRRRPQRVGRRDLVRAPDGGEPALLLKYLFTSEALDPGPSRRPEARAAGPSGGKDEAWIVVDAEPGAVVGLGLRRPSAPTPSRGGAGRDDRGHDRLARAAAGDVYYLPAGTVHALGPGLVLIEVQQNSDLTYRLYDYGRPRPLHVEDGIEAVNPLATVTQEDAVPSPRA